MPEDDIGPYKRHELLTGKIYYPALGYSGYGDGKSTHIADFVNHEMRLDWLANRDRLLAFWKSGEPISCPGTGAQVPCFANRIRLIQGVERVCFRVRIACIRHEYACRSRG
jgi:hypothetical protein